MAEAGIIKRVAAIAAAGCLVCAVGSVVSGSAAGDGSVQEKNGFKYTIPGDGTAVLVGCTREDDDLLIIPAEIDGWTISAIDTGFLGEGSEFGTVVIPSSVKTVAKHAIYGADVNTVILPAGLENIPEDAICTGKMIKAYTDYVESIGGENLGELEVIGQTGILKPVGSALTVKCAAGSKGAAYAESLGADRQGISGYTGLAGDVNCDGKLNNRDLKQLQKFIGGDTSLLTPSFDADGSGAIDEGDIGRLQSYLVGENVKVY